MIDKVPNTTPLIEDLVRRFSQYLSKFSEVLRAAV